MPRSLASGQVGTRRMGSFGGSRSAVAGWISHHQPKKWLLGTWPVQCGCVQWWATPPYSQPMSVPVILIHFVGQHLSCVHVCLLLACSSFFERLGCLSGVCCGWMRSTWWWGLWTVCYTCGTLAVERNR